MENKRSNSLKRVIESVLWVILYIFASFGTCHAMFTLYTAIAHIGRLLEVVLPISTICFVPLFLFIMLRRYKNAVGHRMKWKIGLGTVITLFIVSLYSLISTIVIASNTTGLDNIVTPFFPLDIIVIDVLILLTSLAGVYFLVKYRSWLKEKKQMQQIKEYINVLVGLYLFVSTFGFGAVLKCYEVCVGSDMDNNLVWVIANYLIISLPTIGLIFRLIQKYILKPTNKRAGWIALISVFSFFVLTTYIWAFVGLAINPYYYPQSTQSIFIGGYLFFNMPVEIFVILITCVTAITIESVIFIKNGKK